MRDACGRPRRGHDGTPPPFVDWSWRSPRVWLVPALALIGALALFATDANEGVFLVLNGLGPAMRFGLHPFAQWTITVALVGCAIALLTGYDTGYPQAFWFQHAIGIICLVVFASSFLSQRPRPG